MLMTPYTDDLLIGRIIAMPILGIETYEELEKEGFFPCSLGDLKEFKGVYVDPIIVALERTSYYDDACEDFGYNLPNLHNELIADGVANDVLKNIPSSLSVVWEDEYVRVSVTYGEVFREYYFTEEGQLLKCIYTPGSVNPVTTVREFQYDEDNECIGYITYGDHLRHVGYRQFHPLSRTIYCEQRIYKEEWLRHFDFGNNHISHRAVEETFRWEDYRNRETFRCSDGPSKGEFLITHHRAMLQEREQYGHVYNSYVFQNGVPYCTMSHRYIPKMGQAVTYGTGRKLNSVPNCIYFTYNEDKKLVSVLFGGGHRFTLERMHDDEGSLLGLVKRRWNANSDSAITAEREVLIEYIGTENLEGWV